MTPPTGTEVRPAPIEWDDALWEQVWERTLNPLERHSIAMDILRKRMPQGGPMEAAVGLELARRWRRTARNLAVLYGLWTLFWGALLMDALTDPTVELLPLVPGATAFGVLLLTGCFVIRFRLRELACRR